MKILQMRIWQMKLNIRFYAQKTELQENFLG